MTHDPLAALRSCGEADVPACTQAAFLYYEHLIDEHLSRFYSRRARHRSRLDDGFTDDLRQSMAVGLLDALRLYRTRDEPPEFPVRYLLSAIDKAGKTYLKLHTGHAYPPDSTNSTRDVPYPPLYKARRPTYVDDDGPADDLGVMTQGSVVRTSAEEAQQRAMRRLPSPEQLFSYVARTPLERQILEARMSERVGIKKLATRLGLKESHVRRIIDRFKQRMAEIT